MKELEEDEVGGEDKVGGEDEGVEEGRGGGGRMTGSKI